MKLLKIFFIVGMAILFSDIVNAKMVQQEELINTKLMDAAHAGVVSPGTRLVAGDPRQNEFYILGKSEAQYDEAKVKVALKKTLHPKVKVAINNKQHELIRNKINSKRKLGLNQKHRNIKKIHVAS